jgi:hypothetical protein
MYAMEELKGNYYNMRQIEGHHLLLERLTESLTLADVEMFPRH